MFLGTESHRCGSLVLVEQVRDDAFLGVERRDLLDFVK